LGKAEADLIVKEITSPKGRECFSRFLAQATRYTMSRHEADDRLRTAFYEALAMTDDQPPIHCSHQLELSTEEFKFFERQVCAGLGIPPELVYPGYSVVRRQLKEYKRQVDYQQFCLYLLHLVEFWPWGISILRAPPAVRGLLLMSYHFESFWCR
jgi:hypothetical protein